MTTLPTFLRADDYSIHVVNGIGLAKYDFSEEKPDANNIPILYFHGTSSSKLEPLLVLKEIKAKKRTVISFDRPGYGHSAAYSFGNLNDYAKWSKTKLIPAVESVLGYKPKQFDFVSVSGGAMYSMRLAQEMPTRIRKMSLISAGLFARPVGAEGAYEDARRLAARRPRFSNFVVRLGNRNLDFMHGLSSQKYSAPDKAFADCHIELSKQLYQDATRCGAFGISQDAQLQLCDTSYAKPLPKEINVEMWNGLCDNTISQESAKLLVKRTGITMNVIKNEGHISSIPVAFLASVIAEEKTTKNRVTTKRSGQ